MMPTGSYRHPAQAPLRPAGGSPWSGVAAFALLLAGYALIANRLDRLSIGPALVFVVVGIVLGPVVLGVVDLDVESTTVRHVAEVTLALVLFTDASTVDLAGLRRDPA